MSVPLNTSFHASNPVFPLNFAVFHFFIISSVLTLTPFSGIVNLNSRSFVTTTIRLSLSFKNNSTSPVWKESTCFRELFPENETIHSVPLVQSLAKELTKHRETESVFNGFRDGKSVKNGFFRKAVTFCILFAQKKQHRRLHFHALPLFF